MADKEIQADIFSLLKYGKENAITGEALAKLLGFHGDRAIRLAIRELIAGRVAVASSVNPPFGYFIANTPEEVNEYLAVMKGRLVNDAYRRRDFKRASRVILDPHQMTLI